MKTQIWDLARVTVTLHLQHLDLQQPLLLILEGGESILIFQREGLVQV